MPFITQERRIMVGLMKPAKYPPDIQAGDLCYRHYKPMVDRWRASPRWTTAHEIYRDVCTNLPRGYDELLAKQLAWQVFFQLHIMPYEIKKRDENGDI